MNEPLRVDLFGEDIAHEKLLVELIERVAREEGIIVRQPQPHSARGGRAKAISEFRNYLRLLTKGYFNSISDLVVVAIDSNCTTFSQTRAEIEQATQDQFKHLIVPACPDPHIERWYMADPDSFYRIVGHRPVLAQKKCERGYYKHILQTAIREAGHPQPLGGVEFAAELAEAMDLYQAGKADVSLKAFLDDLRAALKNLARESGVS